METRPAAAHSTAVRRPPRWVLLTLLCLALVIRGRVMLANAESLLKDPDAYGSVSWHIARTHTIGLWRDDVGRMVPTATRPVLYPLLLSVFDFLPWKTDPYGYGWLHVLLGVGTVWSVWRLGQAWGLSIAESLLAAGLITLDPILLGQSVQLMTETLATFLASVTLLALSRSARADAPWWEAALTGVLLGLCVLCRPTFLAWSILVTLLIARRAGGGRKLARAATLVCAAAAVVTPWAIRNQLLFGRPIITTTHGGYTLLVANNPGYYEFLRSAPWGSVWDAKEVYDAWRTRQDLIDTPGPVVIDEVAADRWAYRQAWENIRREPLMFIYACAARSVQLWGIVPHQTSPNESTSRRGLRYAIGIGYALELALAAAGVWFLGRKFWETPWIWGAGLIVSFAAVHAFYWTDLRMRAPLMVVVVLLAAHGVSSLASPRQRSSALHEAT